MAKEFLRAYPPKSRTHRKRRSLHLDESGEKGPLCVARGISVFGINDAGPQMECKIVLHLASSVEDASQIGELFIGSDCIYRAVGLLRRPQDFLPPLRFNRTIAGFALHNDVVRLSKAPLQGPMAFIGPQGFLPPSLIQ